MIQRLTQSTLVVIVAAALAAPVGAQAPVIRGGAAGAQVTGWRIVRSVTDFGNKVSYTAVLRSADELASLRVYCTETNDLTVFLTVPSSVRVTSRMTTVEARFDENEFVALVADRLNLGAVVRIVGGDPTADNYAFSGDAGATGSTAVSRKAASELLVKRIASKSLMAYRFSSAEGGGAGSQGVFQLAGFAAAAGPMLKECHLLKE
jgi:hypothetical protein